MIAVLPSDDYIEALLGESHGRGLPPLAQDHGEKPATFKGGWIRWTIKIHGWGEPGTALILAYSRVDKLGMARASAVLAAREGYSGRALWHRMNRPKDGWLLQIPNETPITYGPSDANRHFTVAAFDKLPDMHFSLLDAWALAQAMKSRGLVREIISP